MNAAMHPKVIAATTGSVLGGACATLLIWAIRLHGVEVPHEVAGAINTVSAAIVAAISGYTIPSPAALPQKAGL